MKMKLNPKAYVAEFFGTFILTLIVIVSINVESVLPTPVLAAITLGLLVYLLGPICGTNINPAVTIGLFVLKKLDLGNTFVYLFVQLLGSLSALLVSQLFLDSKVVSPVAILSWGVFFAEFLGTMVFTYGIASVVLGRVRQELGGVVIGCSLLIGITIASIGSNGILNPTVAFGIGSFNVSYLLGPIAGGIVGMVLSKIMNNEK
ncbi:aquaporin [Candidatus Dojkabacteria bacterium]|nr:aquaporin [Candidatus Dojkabacteria bacterium]